MIVLSRVNLNTAGSKKRIGMNRKSLVKRIVDYRYIYLLGLPGLVVLFLFQYLPLSGILMAFQNYNPHLGLIGSEWVGLKHFKVLFADPKFYSMLRNTLTISGLNLLTFPAPIILALLLNEVRRTQFKKFIQTSVYLPHFLCWAIVASLTFFLLSREQGLVNKLAVSMGDQPMAYLFSPKWIYPIIIFQQSGAASAGGPSSIWRPSPASNRAFTRLPRSTGPTSFRPSFGSPCRASCRRSRSC